MSMLALMDRLERFYGPLPLPPEDPFAFYVWDVLGVRTTPSRRDAAMSALRRIPALTPDSMGKAARAKLEKAVALAGPHREERLRALSSGIDVFKRNRDLPRNFAATSTRHERRWRCFRTSRRCRASGCCCLPEVMRCFPTIRMCGACSRVFKWKLPPRLKSRAMCSRRCSARRCTSHHGRATCLVADPLCHICPLRSLCPFRAGGHHETCHVDRSCFAP